MKTADSDQVPSVLQGIGFGGFGVQIRFQREKSQAPLTVTALLVISGAHTESIPFLRAKFATYIHNHRAQGADSTAVKLTLQQYLPFSLHFSLGVSQHTTSHTVHLGYPIFPFSMMLTHPTHIMLLKLNFH